MRWRPAVGSPTVIYAATHKSDTNPGVGGNNEAALLADHGIRRAGELGAVSRELTCAGTPEGHLPIVQTTQGTQRPLHRAFVLCMKGKGWELQKAP